jgi:hypothetical protein
MVALERRMAEDSAQLFAADRVLRRTEERLSRAISALQIAFAAREMRAAEKELPGDSTP